MECSCEINGLGGDENYEDPEEKILVHQSPSVILKCGECGEEIKIGDEFEWYRGYYDDEEYVHHTCLDCLSLRHYFFGDWAFERVWEDFRYNMDDCDWEVPESCLSKVTPKTRAKICEWIEKSWNRDHE